MTSINHLTARESPIVIIDIGASLIESEAPEYQALIESGCAKLIAFEPDETALKALREKYPPPHLCLPLFVGNGQAATFFETTWGPTGSLFEPNTALLEKFHHLADITRLVRTHPVETVRLDDITEIADADFIKIDAQGSEQMIFENAERILKQVTLIQTEVSWVELYKGMPLFSDIDRVLRSMGFQLHTRLTSGYRSFAPLLNNNHPHAAFKQELWSDVVYVRDWMKFDQVPHQKLLKLAVLLHDLYDSFDLAHAALAAADAQAGTNHAARYLKWVCDDQRGPLELQPLSCAGKLGLQGTATESVSRIKPLRGSMKLAPHDGRSGTATAKDRKEFITIRNDRQIKFSLPADLKCISTYVLLEQGKWFEKEIEFVYRYATSGMTALDIGANVGVYTLPLAKLVGPTGQVIAYEPGTLNRQHLERSLALNQCGNVVVSGAALSDCVGTGLLQIESSGELNQLVAQRNDSKAVESVEVSTLDAELDRFDWAQVDFMKIDAEGHEAAILKGGQRFFKRYSPLIMFEIKHGSETNLGLVEAFQALGLDTYRLLGDGSMLVPVGDADPIDAFELNFFAARADRAASISAAGLLARKGASHTLSDDERSMAIARYCAQPFARTMEIGAADFEQCPFSTALVAYSAYRFLPSLSADRRLALLQQAYEDLQAFCRTSNSAAALSSLSRVAQDFGLRSTALDALRHLLATDKIELDQPFFPPAARFESLDTLTPDVWFVYAINEVLELGSSHSSLFGRDMSQLKWLAAQESASDEIARRLILAGLIGGLPVAEVEVQLAGLQGTEDENSVAWHEAVRSLMASQ